MRVDLFDFHLPPERIAARPAVPRDCARLLSVGADGFADHIVRDLPALLLPGDVLVLNDTRVLPARLTGRRGDARIEVTLLSRLADGVWNALARPAKRLKAGQEIIFADGFSACVVAREGAELRLEFTLQGEQLRAALERHGVPPLPPYIPRADGADARDKTDYQTVHAANDGAVAAPTAGLHMTEALFEALAARGVTCEFITLHVGAGTFVPVRAADTADHVMHGEWGALGAEVAARINGAREAGGRVVAVGSTSLRILERAADEAGRLSPFAGDIDLFIVPGYRFKIVDLMMTNFHLPRSTLYMLVSAFAGMARMRAAYAHAISAGYRFYSYGDACLLARAKELSTP
ncbi:MAG: tRNA preQ1(34) S-adenosylmethionine ribosyltransferase-isomerase QueA [Alphaproteobacteria bacterium]|jgi:S-adenosylmethionine:tRNA ribosyltransferase-isomerase|nr:tRNA preQ1(34) S-adenosylmethionine ribosyltransferase-isomerase QueA [Alphaproteobacteria bacterium]MDP6819050.1 tRNA preQ1(34) S-adenosylmethionine ribosyltransferase-isomerase QueA [Alphaproteobacteria bacterium]